MRGDYSVSVYVVSGVAAALLVGFSLPPLLPRGASSTSEKQVRIVNEEQNFCEANLDRVNCECFANTAGYILAQDSAPVPGMVYVERTELARGQATRTC